MAIIRVIKNNNFTVVSNAHLKDKRLSLRAKGVMTIMLSLPDEWDFSVRGLASLSDDGYQSTAKALSELEEFGYLVRTSVRSSGKFSDVEYALYEEPQTENVEKGALNEANQPKTDLPQTASPITVKPITVEPITEKPITVEQTNKILKNKELNNKILKESECAPARTHTREEPIEGLSGSRPVSKPKFVPPTLEEVRAYIAEKGYNVNAEDWIDHYKSNGWMVGRVHMQDWKAAVRTWTRNGIGNNKATPPPGNSGLASSFDTDDFFEAAMRRSGMLNENEIENESEEKKNGK